VDVYELIIQRGTLGALKYANQIENKNPRLASQIDEAVIRLCKNAGMTGMIRTAQDLSNLPYTPLYPVSPQNYNYTPAPSTPSEQFTPEYDPSEYTTGYYRPKGEKEKNQNNFGASALGFAGGVALPYSKWLVLKNQLAKGYLGKLKNYKQLLIDGNFEGAAKILNSAPKEYQSLFDSGKVRQQFLDAAKAELGDGEEYRKFVQDAAGSLKADLTENAAKNKLLKKIPGITEKWLHPAIQSIDDAAFTPGVKNALRGKTIEEAKLFLENNPKLSKLLPVFEKQIASSEALSATEKFIQTAPSKNSSAIKQGLQLAAEKFPALAEFLPKIAKYLGPIGVALEAKGFFDDVNKYGWDNKTLCTFVSLIAGAASLIPPLAPVMAPIWGAVSIGCLFVQHGKPLEGKSEPSDKEDVNDINDENVFALKGKVKMSDLSDKDKRISQEIYDQYKDDRDELIREFNSNAMTPGRFDKPVSVLAGVQAQLDGGQFFE